MAVQSLFTTIRTEGALLPPDLLQRITDGKDIDGLTPADYHRSGEKLNEAINRAWNALQGAWANFKTAQEKLPQGDLGTSITRERWLLPLFRELDYGRLQAAPAYEIDGRSYPISHRWEEIPIHLVSYQLDLDHRAPGIAGASSASPHSLVQVFLNRSQDHLWGFVSNGLLLRVLRDNASMTRQAYVEFDLQAMMDGEVYADFVVLWLLCHQSRVENGRDCWLEKWTKVAQEQGTRALDQLRDGVQAAIEALGAGFLDHPRNTALRDRLGSGTLNAQDYYRELLRLVYRILFLFVAEDRGMLYDPTASEAARECYTQFYSTRRLRHIAERLKGTRHADLFESVRLVMRLLGGEADGREGLGLPVLGSYLFRDEAVADIIGCQIANVHLLDAVRALAFVNDQAARVLRAVDYKNLGPEELGSVYESLLELHPQINIAASSFALATAGGNERKTTGSYYTPTSLINALLDSALDPVIAEARKQSDPKAALLALKVCDPACGSGHFLIAAAHRIAKVLAQARTGEEEPAPDATRHALRDVIGHCIYGVDINPMAVELCKVNLWMEALEPGKPLSFLDHRIQVGNSLLGTTPALMAKGIPDDAFNPIEGDDAKIAAAIKKQNKQARKDRETGQQNFLHLTTPAADYGALSAGMTRLDAVDDATLDGIRAKEERYRQLANDPEYQKARGLADAWCAAFVWDKSASNTLPPMTDLFYRRLEQNPLDPQLTEMRAYVEKLHEHYQFFHWHVAFPDVFTVVDDPQSAENEQTGWDGGFSCVLGNPPWEKVQLEEKKFFASTYPEIASASTLQRKKMIKQLEEADPELFHDYLYSLRINAGETHLIRASGAFPLTGKGNIATHTVFIEVALLIVRSDSRIGLIVPSGLATQDSQKELYGALVSAGRLQKFYDFENRQGLFPNVHRSFKFSVVIIGNATEKANTEYAFYLQDVTELMNRERLFELTYDDLKRISPNTLSCPTLLSKGEIRIFSAIYRYSTILFDENSGNNPWGWHSWQMFNETHEVLEFADCFNNETVPKTIRLYEAKLIHQFDHRYATYDTSDIDTEYVSAEQKNNPTFLARTRHCVREEIWNERVQYPDISYRWILGFRRIARATDERTAIFTIIPYAATGSQTPVVTTDQKPPLVCAFTANLNAFAFDFVARRKVGGTDINHFIIHQTPVMLPQRYTSDLITFIVPRVLELTYTAWDLQPFAHDVGYDGTPFIWDEDRRFLMRCELDALYFHLYGIARDDVDYIMETFPIIKRKDEAAHGEFRTKRVILEMYDEMAASGGVVGYQTRLDPPPADPRVAHPVKEH